MLLSVALAPGCLLSTSGLSGGVRPTDEAGAPEAGSSTPEAGADATTTADAGGPYCASLVPAPAFCADFDESTDPTSGWSQATQGKQGSHAIDSATFTSGGHSLATLLPASRGETDLQRTVGSLLDDYTNQIYDHITLDLDVRMESASQNLGAQVATLFFGSNGNIAYAVHIDTSTGSTVLQEDITATQQYPNVPLPTGIPLNTWTHVQLDVRFSTQQIKVTVNQGAPFLHTMNAGAVKDVLSMEVGAIYFANDVAVPASSFHHDNVVLRVE